MSTLDVVDRLRELPSGDFKYRSRAELATFREELRTARDDAYREMGRISEVAAGRPLTRTQRQDYDAAARRCEEAGALVERVQDALADKDIDYSQIILTTDPTDANPARLPGDAFAALVGSRDAYEGRALTRTQTFAGFTRSRGLVQPGEDDLDLGRYLRGVVTGDWTGATAEQRAMSEGVLSAGGVLVPTLLAAQIIDLARNQTRVIQAGASILPMPNQTLDVAKWTGDPSSAWHSENAAITPSDATMTKVTLKAKSLAALTVVSRELVEDAPNVGTELARAFAASFAVKIDKAGLYGSGTDPEPRGIKNTSGVTLQSMGTNGAALSNYDPFVDAVGTLADANETANGGIIVAPRTERSANKLKDTTNQPLNRPSMLNNLPFLGTNQVPVNLTQGTSTDASDAFVADWSQLILGVRTQLMIEPLRERYADNGQLGFVAWWRGDVAVARAAAFVTVIGIRP